MLTSTNVSILQDFLRNAGVLDGLSPQQADAVCIDLCWTVEGIVTEAQDKLMEELKVAAVMATSDCLEEQRHSLLQAWQAQLACPQ